MGSDDDDVLLARFREGDQQAFAGLVQRYHRPIYNAAFWILRRPEDANDVTQMVFMKVVERLDDYNPQFKFFSWIYRIAVNESLNLLRRNGREQAIEDDFDAEDVDAAGPEQQLLHAQRARRLREVMMGMSTNDRIVLTLRHFSDCSYVEIAQILEIDEGTVKSRLFEARLRLRAQLGDLRLH